MNIQERVWRFREKHGDVWVLPGLRDTLLFVVSEVGELADALIRRHPLREGYFRTHTDITSDIEIEIGDALVMLCTLATQLEIDIDHAVEASLNKTRERIEDENLSS